MDFEAHEMVVLLWTALGLLLALVLVLLFVSLLILRRVGRLERYGHVETAHADPAEAAPPAVETSPGGAFEAFLDEDPERRNLTKTEQFKAYRKWRQEKGLNWSAP